MATPTILLNGLNWEMYMDPAATPVVPTLTQLGARNLTTEVAANATIAAFIIPANLLKIIEIPPFGPSEDATVTWTLAGQRYGDQTVVQAAPPKMSIVFPFVPSDPLLSQLTTDSYSGNVDRTFVMVGRGTGTDAIVFATVGRASSYTIEASPTDVSKITIPIALRGNQFGWSFLPSA